VFAVKTVDADVLVIGTGIAGLSYALKASAHGRVAIVTKKRRADSSTNWAQGGVAAVFAAGDSPELHARDTFLAGCGLCHTRAVRGLVNEGPARVRELEAWGVEFTRAGGGYELGREGGHSRRRIVHAGDLTGREIEHALLAALADAANVALYEDHIAIDLVTGFEKRTGRKRCAGAFVLDHVENSHMQFNAGVVMLAAGGLGQVYRHTTNPDIATGDGMAMAWRAGAEVANLEFVQFHPTALYPADEHAFLISEAVRGEGAVLRRKDGTALMEGVHALGSLAPRDVVARTIHLELKRSGEPCVWLDLSPLSRSRLESRFPGILAECERRGHRLPAEPLPVVPAAHYSCGGARTAANGQTTLDGLFAAGEVACTGVHGANRLASNSLLEAVVYSHRAAAELTDELRRASREPLELQPPEGGDLRAQSEGASVQPKTAASSDVRRRIRDLMWQEVGIVRDHDGLTRAATEIELVRSRIAADSRATDPAGVELRNVADTAALIVSCARQRRESRGLHYHLNFPYRDNERFLRDTVLVAEKR
jgi:L-aspartate oxidase